MTETCDDCTYANWERTAIGSLHPKKQGKCKAFDSYSIPELPAAFFWGTQLAPKPYGGRIERGVELNKPCSWRKTEVALIGRK